MLPDLPEHKLGRGPGATLDGPGPVHERALGPAGRVRVALPEPVVRRLARLQLLVSPRDECRAGIPRTGRLESGGRRRHPRNGLCVRARALAHRRRPRGGLCRSLGGHPTGSDLSDDGRSPRGRRRRVSLFRELSLSVPQGLASGWRWIRRISRIVPLLATENYTNRTFLPMCYLSEVYCAEGRKGGAGSNLVWGPI